MTPEEACREERLRELAVIRAARDFVTENKPGLGQVFHDPAAQLREAMENLATWHGSDTHLLADMDQELCGLSAPEEPVWVARTLADVRAGDTVRLPAAPDLPARVVFAAPLDWHVRSGGDGPKAHYNDVPLEHRMINVRLDFEGGPRDGDGRPILREMPADVPIEIRLSAQELRAIELLGWDNRLYTYQAS